MKHLATIVPVLADEGAAVWITVVTIIVLGCAAYGAFRWAKKKGWI
jgi:hypothetical protein